MHGLESKQAEISAFTERVRNLDLSSLAISDYNKQYFSKHQASVEYSVQLALQILGLCSRYSNKPLSRLCLAEIGAGTGIICLLAKWLGFGKVIYSDTFETSCRDFTVLSASLGISCDEVIIGSIREISEHITFPIHCIVSRDVIEHIYKPALFLRDCRNLFPQTMSVHNTSANRYNVFRMAYFKRIHKMDELRGNPDQFKPGDSKEAFFTLRRNYLKNRFPQLTDSVLNLLATRTRGMNYSDIDIAADAYIVNGTIPPKPAHPTNTCDPANGNWTEQLISTEDYTAMADPERYMVKWHYAPYDQWTAGGLKKWLLRVMNKCMEYAGFAARYVSPALVMIVLPVSKANANNSEHPA